MYIIITNVVHLLKIPVECPSSAKDPPGCSRIQQWTDVAPDPTELTLCTGSHVMINHGHCCEGKVNEK